MSVHPATQSPSPYFLLLFSLITFKKCSCYHKEAWQHTGISSAKGSEGPPVQPSIKTINKNLKIYHLDNIKMIYYVFFNSNFNVLIFFVIILVTIRFPAEITLCLSFHMRT